MLSFQAVPSCPWILPHSFQLKTRVCKSEVVVSIVGDVAHQPAEVWALKLAVARFRRCRARSPSWRCAHDNIHETTSMKQHPRHRLVLPSCGVVKRSCSARRRSVRSIIQIDFTSSDSPCSRNIAKQNKATEVQIMGEFPVCVWKGGLY